MTLYYPECDGDLFDVNIASERFNTDAEAVEYYVCEYGTLLIAVVKDDDPVLTLVYERDLE